MDAERNDRLRRTRSSHTAERGLTFCKVAVFVMFLAGCDFQVTIPGPVADSFLDSPEAAAALVNGIERGLSESQNKVGFQGIVIAREEAAAGNPGNHGHNVAVRAGLLRAEDRPAVWATAHRGRWIAETGLARLRLSLGETAFATSPLAARTFLYAGYTNRILGENMCYAVIDGGPEQPRTVHLERAEAHFTNAITHAQAAGLPDLATAARAARASVRLTLGKWTDAVADAQAIPDAFKFQAKFTGTTELENNRIVNANVNEPWRALSVYGTFFEAYYPQTGDPRTPWTRNPKVPLGDGVAIPWLIEQKYNPNRRAPINLSSGREMRLIEAEALLRQNAWQEALVKINRLRQGLRSNHTGQPLPLWEATTADEAWRALKLERAIEFWLENRTLGDHRRYAENKVPGQLPPLFDMTGRSLCFPTSQPEVDTNPNIPSK
ncbi:MAG: RagB/SusD family nutrient uptake outer membrane protein [Gemmatimonadetes bacterium]|nr:RagB/SusD family nutrient uptake outer membrane protein [Gemmatimonadota bacterium]